MPTNVFEVKIPSTRAIKFSSAASETRGYDRRFRGIETEGITERFGNSGRGHSEIVRKSVLGVQSVFGVAHETPFSLD